MRERGDTSFNERKEYSSFEREEYFQISLSQPFRGAKFQFKYTNPVRIQLNKRSFKF